LVFVLVLGLVAFTTVTARLFIWPDLPPLPPRVDAIVELAGPGNADPPALALAREHRAPILVQSTIEEALPGNHCLPGMPSGVELLCFYPRPNTTQGEAEYTGQLARQRHWKSIIVVTTRDHAWRARLWFTRCFDGQVYVATTGLPALLWFRQVPYQWVATTKALMFDRTC
jgi:uncharacterized SAM-binding protein YcdF (DUF218 family)